MYDHIYDEMHATGLTKEYECPVMVNESGLIANDVNESYGMAVTTSLSKVTISCSWMKQDQIQIKRMIKMWVVRNLFVSQE